MIGECLQWNDTNCVGTGKGLFHIHLSALGKTTRVPDKWKVDYPLYLMDPIPRIPNPIFLYEMQQLVFDDKNDGGGDNIIDYAQTFRNDLKKLLNLNTSLPSTIQRRKPDMNHFNKRQQRRKNKFKINICEPKYQPLRDELMKVARESSVWIRNEFIQSDDVFVSGNFRSHMEAWMDDPCQGQRGD